MEKRVVKSPEALYEVFLDATEDERKEILNLQKEKERLILEAKKQKEKALVEGGKESQELQAQIEEIDAQIESINKDFDEQKSKVEEQVYLSDKETQKLLKKQEKRKTKKSLASKIGLTAALPILTGFLAHRKYKSDYNQALEQAKQDYLQNSEYAQNYVQKFIDGVNEAQQGLAYQIGFYKKINTNGVTTANFIEKCQEFFGQSFEIKESYLYGSYVSKNNPYVYDLLADGNYVQGIWDGFDASAAVAGVVNYTPVTVLGTLLITSVCAFGPYAHTLWKIKKSEKQSEQIKQEVEKQKNALEEQRKEAICGLEIKDIDLRAQRNVVLAQESAAIVDQINQACDEKCALIDLKIERATLRKNIRYNEYLREMAAGGQDIAISEESRSKYIRLGQSHRYQTEIDSISQKLTKVETKITTQNTKSEDMTA